MLMILRAALLLLLTGLLAGCVSSGSTDPLRTDEGRQQARDAYIQLGIGYLQQGAAARAKTPLRKALEIDPNSADAHAALALVFQTEMENELADKHYREALSSRKDARILNNYGSFLFEQKRYPEAMERFRQASEDNMYSERARVFQNLGMTALQLGQREEAELHFTRSLRLDSRQPRALLELAIMPSRTSNTFQPSVTTIASANWPSRTHGVCCSVSVWPTSIRTATLLQASRCS